VITQKQAETARILADIKFKGAALAVCLLLLVAGFVAMVVAIFWVKTIPAATAATLTEGVFGWIFHQVYGNLFPTPKP